MQLEEERIYEVFKKFEIRIQGQTISKEKLLKSFGQYLTQTFSKRDHNVGLIMHTGSVCFDAMLVTYAMIFNLISNKAETRDVINSFSEGDIVLYGQNKKSRYFFSGFADGSEFGTESGKKYIKLTQGGTSVNYIPEKSWRNIEPYNGDSVRMDGRGIRKKTSLRDDFFVEVLGFTKENIPSVLDTSCVIVAPRDRVDYLVKNISLIFDKKKISLLELATASYFTEEDEYRYGGNTGKNEPTLKFTAKVSAARQLLLSRRGNRHLGLIVLGEDSISRGSSELHELINRKSLQYVYLSSSINSELAFALTSDIEETEVFACTKDFLLENSTTDIAEINDYTLKLSKQVNTIIEKDNKLIVLEENGLQKEIVYEFKKIIIAIKRNEYSTDGKERFIMLAYSLMKLFVTAPFPMDRFSVTREKGIIDVSTPREKIKEMEVLLTEFPNDLREKATLIVHILEKVLEREENITAKYEWLRKYLYSHVGEKTAIVVPKAYYITILKGSGLFSDYFFRKKDFTTPNRFDNSQMYECVIVLGDYEGKAFNTWRTNNIGVQRRVDHLNENYAKSYYGDIRPRTISAKFLLLHTLSHLLMKQLSFECGYSIASIKERIYCSEASEGKNMSGILIYTASGDSEGTMGGLVRQGRPDTFPTIFKRAIESAMTCSNDPVCSLSMGQGRDSLNLSACYACTLVPETSCEEFNVFLDRGVIVGTYEEPEIGFFSHYIYQKENATVLKKGDEEKNERKNQLLITEVGMDLKNVDYTDVWRNMLQFSLNKHEKEVIKEMISKAEEYQNSEKPYQAGTFQVLGDSNYYNVDLYWPKTKIMIFGAENDEEYTIAAKSEWKCYYLGSEDVNADSILSALKEK